MNKIFPRFILVLIVTALAFYMLLPTMQFLIPSNSTANAEANSKANLKNDEIMDNSAKNSNSGLNLGLDLKGGVHLLLKADLDFYLNAKYDDFAQSIKKILKKHRIKYENLKITADGIVLTLKNSTKDNSELIKKEILDLDRLLYINFDTSSNTDQKSDTINVEIGYFHHDINMIFNQVLDQSIAILRNRVDNTGTKEPIIQKQGSDKIILEMPGMKDATQLKNAIGKTAKLSFHIVENQKNQDNITLKAEKGEELIISKYSELSGDMLQDVAVTFDEYSRPCVSFKLNTKGTKIFANLTSNNIGKRLAIVLDNLIVTAPNINSAIKEGSGIISGNFDIESAKELVTFLKSGSLATKLEIIEEKIIGPTLGEKNIQDMKLAGLVAMTLVIGFMIFYYKILGIFASISLILALVYMFAMLTLFNATLTLPGIAGIILTIGMAVDANILIYERIKEDFKNGMSLPSSIRIGFKTALATIIDSNVTTLIVAAILYMQGTGPIRGFAITLTIGILSSMFTAIIITKLMIDIWMQKFKPNQI